VSADEIDRFAAARAIADAVLYEGYVLYPYRASARKNQLRWQFGVLTPRVFSEADGSERWSTRTECLADPGAASLLAVRVRCLQLQHRSVEAPPARGRGSGEKGEFRPVEKLVVDDEVYVEWDEALDQVVDLAPLALHPGRAVAREETFRFHGGTTAELIRSADGSVAGRVVRRREPLWGRVHVTASPLDGSVPLIKLAVTVENATPCRGTRRDEVLGRCLVALHTMLAIDGGTFVSLLDPPEHARRAAGDCQSDGAFPVLVGDDDVVLSSPIILYDHPEVAPESPGDLYDATEIDEILALRVLTLTDEEKAEARGTDPRAAAVVDRCDDMAPELWERLHGAMRSTGSSGDQGPEAAIDGDPEPAPWWDPSVDALVDPWSDAVTISGVEVAKGASVRLRPSRRSDAQDLFLDGRSATVAGVFKDVDGNEHVAVTVDDDPATEVLAWQGRYLFFSPDEVEPLPGREGVR
jgi:hypothetical protein